MKTQEHVEHSSQTQERSKLLFVCMANVNRSPTFERWFKKNRPQYEVKSCGCYYAYYTPMNEETLEWANKIFVMDMEQEIFIANKYPRYLFKVEVIGISDDYQPDESKLIEIIEYWAKKKKL